eukprot:1710684-Amphidinium_carterae.1
MEALILKMCLAPLLLHESEKIPQPMESPELSDFPKVLYPCRALLQSPKYHLVELRNQNYSVTLKSKKQDTLGQTPNPPKVFKK